MSLRALFILFALLFQVSISVKGQEFSGAEQTIKKLNELVKKELSSPDSISVLTDQLEKLSKEQSNTRGLLYSRFFRGVALLQMELTDSSVNVLTRVLDDISKEERDSSLLYSRVMLILGNSYYQKSDYKNALYYYQQVKKETDRVGREETTYSVDYNIGLLHLLMKEFDLAYEYLTKARGQYKELLPSAQARLWAAFGTYYSQLTQLDSAAFYYRKGMKKHKENGDLRGVAHGFNNLAIVAYQQGNVEEAIVGFESALEVRLQLGNKRNISDGYYNIGLLYAGQGRYDKAINSYRNGLNEIKGIGSLITERDLLFELADAFERTKQIDSAYKYLSEWRIMNDSLLEINKKKEILALEKEFQTAQLEKDAQLAEKEIELKTAQRNVLLLSFGGFLLLAIIVFYLLRLRYKRNIALSEKEKLLAEKQSALTMKELSLKQDEMANYTSQLSHKTELLEELRGRLNEKADTKTGTERADVDRMAESIVSNLFEEKNWISFKIQFEKAYPKFLDKLLDRSEALSANDQRLATLIKVNLSNKEIAQVLNISSDSVAKAKYRLRQKMGFDHFAALENYISKI
ncbi:hypothetical protein BFP71_05940 [Roseivirga misakiensis]|uniref:Uncharacterized protein n=2 Tax=Roseivirga misakiensis TaxID=1563681 RepID=A0A1E5T731_9BACT|nr:hypothetical protein BFP71_05940 [Roseivirga misakiensis]